MSRPALALAAVFAWAAVAKLRDRPATERSLAALGIPAPAAVAIALPLGELLLVALLLAAPVVGSAVALAALAGFTTQLVLARRRGVDAGCGCFGGVRPVPPSVELLRNGALGALAVLVLLTA